MSTDFGNKIQKDLTFLIHSVVFIVVVFSFFYYLAYIDMRNMINNGYINKNAILFQTDSIDTDWQNDLSNFMLMQQNYVNSPYKYVYIKGNISLPPYNKIEKNEIKMPYVLYGKRHLRSENLPFPVVGEFNDSGYLLSSQIWVIDKLEHFDINRGNVFIFQTTSLKNKLALKQFLNEDLVQVYDIELKGTYNLRSNSSLILTLEIVMILVGLYFVVFIYTYTSSQKNTIKILYYHGVYPNKIYFILFKRKIIVTISCLVLVIGLYYLLEQALDLTWDYRWLVNATLTLITYFLFITLLTIILLFKHSKSKGGNRM